MLGQLGPDYNVVKKRILHVGPAVWNSLDEYLQDIKVSCCIF